MGDTRRARASDVTAAALFTPAALFILLFWAGPMVLGMLLSLRGADGARFVGLANYRQVLGEATFHQNIRLSLLYVAGVVGLTIPVAYAAATALARLPERGCVRSLFLIPWVIPPVVSALVFRAMAADAGPLTGLYRWLSGDPRLLPLQDGGWAMATIVLHSVWRSVAFITLFLGAGLAAIPESLFEAAAVDGATRWQRFWSLQFPLTRPHLAVGLVLVTAFTLQDAETVYALTSGGPAHDTEVAAVRLFKEAFDYGQMHVATAVGGLLLLVGLVFMGGYLALLRQTETAA